MDFSQVEAEQEIRARRREELFEIESELNDHRADIVADASSKYNYDMMFQRLEKARVAKNKLTTEAHIEYRSFQNLASIGAEQVIGSRGKVITTDKFLEDVLERFSNDKGFNWVELGEATLGLVARAPTISFLYQNGPIAIVKKARKQTERREKDKKEEKTFAAEFNPNAATATMSDKRVKDLMSIMDQNNLAEKPVPAFELLVNPESFSQTIENIFDYASLLKDGKAGINLDSKTGILIASRTLAPETGVENEKKIKSSLMTMNFNKFKKICEDFKIKQSEFVPTRAKQPLDVRGATGVHAPPKDEKINVPSSKKLKRKSKSQDCDDDEASD